MDQLGYILSAFNKTHENTSTRKKCPFQPTFLQILVQKHSKDFPKRSADSTTVEISFILTKNNLVSFLLPSSFDLDYFSIFSFRMCKMRKTFECCYLDSKLSRIFLIFSIQLLFQPSKYSKCLGRSIMLGQLLLCSLH